jgi:hypothetical protein
MLKRDGEHSIAFLLLLVGGHMVAGELLQKQAGMAVYESLGVLACVLIFVGAEALLAFVRRKGGE